MMRWHEICYCARVRVCVCVRVCICMRVCVCLCVCVSIRAWVAVHSLLRREFPSPPPCSILSPLPLIPSLPSSLTKIPSLHFIKCRPTTIYSSLPFLQHLYTHSALIHSSSIYTLIQHLYIPPALIHSC